MFVYPKDDDCGAPPYGQLDNTVGFLGPSETPIHIIFDWILSC